MTIATLKYDLSDPDDNEVFMLAVHSRAMADCLWDIQQMIRKVVKYESEGMTGEDASQRIYEQFFEIKEEFGISDLGDI